MTDSPTDYYVRRAQDERTLADKAADPAVARVHREMASRYDAIVAGATDPSSLAQPKA
jgi:hypothetical protein